LEFIQLKHFVKVAELQSFTLAADAVGLSQSALSRSIAKLEDELGQPLFERKTRSISLTDAGKLLRLRAVQILAMVDDLYHEISDDGQTGQLRVGAIPTIAPFFLPDCLKFFQKQFPQAHVVVQEETTENLLKKVTDGEVDVAFAALPIQAKYLRTESLFEEELLLVMSKDNPLKSRKVIRAADIEAMPFVLLGEAHCLTDNVISFCQQKAFHPVSVERTSQLATVQELVAMNHGISLIPAMARERDTSSKRIYRSLAGSPPQRTIVMISNPYRFQSRLLAGFQRTVREWTSDRHASR
jgi:LysR family hydrogen peroxide-inducible transcriptional activator